MRRFPLSFLLAALAACPLVTASRAHAQTTPRTRDLLFGIGYLRGDARGALAGALGDGQGAGGYLALPVGGTAWLALRLDIALVAPDESVEQFPLVISGQPATVRVNTTSNVASAFLGPQLQARLGPLRPYAFGSVGLSRFVYDLFATATLDDDSTRSAAITTGATRLAAQAGAGIRLPLVGRGGEVQLDASAHLQRGAAVQVPLRSSLAADENGELGAATVRARLDYAVLRAGLAVKF